MLSPVSLQGFTPALELCREVLCYAAMIVEFLDHCRIVEEPHLRMLDDIFLLLNNDDDIR
jgi:hypothetical protein